MAISLTLFSSHRCMYLIVCMLSLVACDSGETIAIQEVDETDRLNAAELHQLRNSQKNVLAPHTYSFGFDLRINPQEDAAQYLPFLDYLEKATGYNFNIHFTSKNSSTAVELGENITQFAAIGAGSFLYAESHYDVTLLARGLNAQGKGAYQSAFVVRPDSAIKSINDIKGRKFAFGRHSSTQGYLIPLIMLSKQGINLSELELYGFTGSHQECAESVISGKYDVCGMQGQLANQLVSAKVVKIIQRSNYYPSSGIAANKHVPADVVERVKSALLNFQPQGKHRRDLYHWDRTEMPHGFMRAHQNDYEDLYKWSKKFGFLQQDNIREQ